MRPVVFRILIAASVLATSAAIPSPALGVTCTRSSANEQHWVQWDLFAQSGVNLRIIESDLRYVAPLVVGGVSQATVKVWDTGSSGLAMMGYSQSASGRVGIIFLTDRNNNPHLNHSFTVSGARGDWREFKIVHSGSTWSFYYLGGLIMSYSLVNDWNGSRARIETRITNRGNQMFGTSAYRWSSRNSRYTSQYGSGPFSAGTNPLSISNTNYFYGAETSGELVVYDKNCA